MQGERSPGDPQEMATPEGITLSWRNPAGDTDVTSSVALLRASKIGVDGDHFYTPYSNKVGAGSGRVGYVSLSKEHWTWPPLYHPCVARLGRTGRPGVVAMIVVKRPRPPSHCTILIRNQILRIDTSLRYRIFTKRPWATTPFTRRRPGRARGASLARAAAISLRP